MRKSVFAGTLAMLILLTSCGYREGIVQPADASFLQFIGSGEAVLVRIDNSEPFMVQPNENRLYRIAPGKHSMQITRNGRLIVDRVLFVGNQATMEVNVP